MKRLYIGLMLALVVGILVGCGGEEATPAPVDEGDGETYTSAVLDTSYPDALSVGNQLALGTIQLEETENAMTPDQATALLPLWQALQGGVTAEAEVNAVLKQIEGTMTQDQLQAIAALQLTQEDLRAWMEEQGLGMGGGFPGAGGDMSEEEQESLRATVEASGGMPGGGPFGDLSEEERADMRATMEAGGGGMTGRPGSGAGGRQFGPLLNPLIELLTERAAE